MPIYEYRCSECQRLETAYRSVADRENAPNCSVCGTETRKIISGYHVHRDFAPYYDDNLETHIQSKAHRRRVMAEQGVEESYGQNWYTSGKKRRKVG